MNIFDCLWPQLLEMGFLTSMITPIVKTFKSKKENIFYTIQDYEEWKSSTNTKGWRVKYYKGLGTSTNEASTMEPSLAIIPLELRVTVNKSKSLFVSPFLHS